MKKTVVVWALIIAAVIVVSVTLYNNIQFYDVYPLNKIKSNDTVPWELNITRLSDNSKLIVKDKDILYENRNKFKVTIDRNVYISTPQYVVEIYTNEKLMDTYYLLELGQVNFGTIEHDILK